MTDILIIVSLLGGVWLLAIFFMRGANPNSGAYDTEYHELVKFNQWQGLGSREATKAYDPMEDQHKIMTGEAESYFD